MCGRYQLTLGVTGVASMHPRAVWRNGHASRHFPRNQIRPTTSAPVMVRPTAPSTSGPNNSDVHVVLMRWGLPSPQAHSQHATGRTLINARRETILQLPTFRRALARGSNARRCAVPATGFFEWHKPRGGGKADPFLVRRKNGDNAIPTMFMAGIYDVRPTELGEEGSFVIITTSACKDFAWLHNRQPCFLDSQKDIDDWLNAARVPSEEAVGRILQTQSGLSCKRMLPDLSQEAANQARPKAQLNITSFFVSKAPKSTQSSRKSSKPDPGRGQRHVRAGGDTTVVSVRDGSRGRVTTQALSPVYDGKITKRRQRDTKLSSAGCHKPGQ